MHAADPRVLRVLTLGAACVVAITAPAHGQVTDQWLTTPRTGGPALGPQAVTGDGGAQVVTAAVDGLGGWDLRGLSPVGWGAPSTAPLPAGYQPVAMGPRGEVLAMIAQTESKGVVARAGLASGGVWQPLPAALSGGATPQFDGVVGTGGTVVIAATDGARVQIATVDGTRVRALSAPGSQLPDLNVNEAGDVLAVWKTRAGRGETAVYAQMAAGRSWTQVRRAPVPRIAPAGALSFDADISASGVGMLAWAAGRTGKNRIWWSMTPGAGQPWNPAAPVAPQPLAAPVVEGLRLSGGGDATVVWSTVRATQSASRISGAAHWGWDGTIPGAPGRGTAARAPLHVVGDRLGTVGVAWSLHGSVSLTTKGTFPGAWPAALESAIAPGTSSIRAAVGPLGTFAVAWTIDAGVGYGRNGLVGHAAAPVAVRAVSAHRSRAGEINIGASASHPGTVLVTITKVGERTPRLAFLAAVGVGENRIPLPVGVAIRLARPGANTYQVRVRGTVEPVAGAGPSATMRVPGTG